MEIEEVLDEVYSKVDQMLHEKRFEEVDIMLYSMDVTRNRTESLIVYLTATLAAKDKLEDRKDFYNRVQDRLVKEYGREESEKMLMGLA